MQSFRLKNGEIVSGKGVVSADILISDGKIKKILKRGEKVDGDFEEIDCSEKLILPGLIDAHVHFRDFEQAYKEDWESGSAAAVSGGVTTVFDMPNNKPPILSCADLEGKRKLINGRSYVNYGLYIGYNGKNISEINKASGICGVKIFAGNSTGNMGVSDEDLEKAFVEISRDRILVFHAEDSVCIAQREKEYLAEFGERDIDPAVHSKIRAPECALMTVKRLCELARKHKRPIHICHVSTEAEFDVISQYRDDGVTCEVAPHHLTLSDEDYGHLGNFIKMNPPVRGRLDVFGVWKCLKAGLVDIIASDHAPHARMEKSAEYLDAPSGVPGVEMILPIFLNTVNDEGMSISELVQLCCERPAELFGLSGSRGRIAEGFDADLVVVDMELEKEWRDADVVSKCGWSPYSGSTFKGWPVMTFVGGELVFETAAKAGPSDGKLVGEKNGKEVEFS